MKIDSRNFRNPCYRARYLVVLLVMPFVTMVLAMLAYMLVHTYLGLPEWQAGDSRAASQASLVEGAVCVALVVVPEYLILFRIYDLNLRTAFRSKSKAEDRTAGGAPVMLSAVAGFSFAMVSGRTIVAEDLFSGSASWVFLILAVLHGLFIAPLINLGEEKQSLR